METYDVVQDQLGYLWFATDRGVCRYDGEYFEKFGLQDGLEDYVVFNLFVDDRNRIWFIAKSPRLCYYDYEQGQVVSYPYNDALSEYAVDDYCLDFKVKDDTVFFPRRFSGLIKVAPDGTVIDASQHLHKELDELNQIEYMDLKDTIFYQLSGFQLHQGAHVINNHPYKRFAAVFTIDGPDYLVTIKFDSAMVHLARTLWRYAFCKEHFIMGAGSRIDIVNASGHHTNQSVDRSIIAMRVDSKNRVWVGYYNGGVSLMELNPESQTLVEIDHFFTNSSITSILEDRSGGFWLTTLNQGIIYIPNLSQRVVLSTESASGRDVSSIAGDGKGNILYVTSDGNIGHLAYNGFDVESTDTLIRDYGRTGHMADYFPELDAFVASARGARLVDLNDMSIRPLVSPNGGRTGTSTMVYDSRRHRIISSAMNNMMICDTNFNAYYDGLSWGFMKSNDLALGQEDTVWLATDQGLYYAMPSGDTITQMTACRSILCRSRIQYIYTLPDGSMLMATRGQGVLIRRQGKLISVASDDGLISDFVDKVLQAPDGTFWVQAKEGISRISFAPGSFDVETIENWRVGGVLRCGEINDIYLDDRQVWLATDAGILTLLQHQDKPTHDAPFYLTKFKVNGEEVDPETSPKLKYHENDIQLAFRVVSFEQTNPEYRYRLNTNSSWIYTPNPVIELQSLQPGDYHIQVQVLHGDGSWQQNTLEVRFRILPPYWRTTWFAVLCVGVALFILLIILLFWQRRSRERNQVRRRVLEHKQEALAAQMNPHFIFNSLNSIQRSILQNDNEVANKYLVDFSKLIRKSLTASRKPTIALEEDISILELYLELETLRFKSKLTYHIEVQASINPNTTYIPPLLVQPFVENAIWHGIMSKPDAGHVKVEFLDRQAQILCVVEDDGIGREAAGKLTTNRPRHVSLGTKITFDRLNMVNELHHLKTNQKITDLYDPQGKAIGTRVEFLIPKLTDHDTRGNFD